MRVRRRVLRVFMDRSFEQNHGAFHVDPAALVNQLSPFHVFLVGRNAGGLGHGWYGRTTDIQRQRDFQCVPDGCGNLVLNGKHVHQVAIVAFRPQVVAVLGLDQLGGDANAVAGLAHRAFQHVADAQFPCNLRHVQVLSLELERRGSRRHAQARVPGDHVEQFLGNTVREKFLVRVVGHVHERQYGDGRAGGLLRIPGFGLRLARLLNGLFDFGRVAFRRQHESVEGEHDNGSSQQPDDPEIEPATGDVRDGLVAVHLFLQLDALWRDLEGPGHDHGQRKAQDYEKRQRRGDPFGQAQRGREQVADLQDQPTDNDVGGRDLENVAAFQFLENRQKAAPCTVRSTAASLPKTGPHLGRKPEAFECPSAQP